MLNTLSSMYQMRRTRIFKFKSKIDIDIEIGPFVVKTVSSSEELRQALEFRKSQEAGSGIVVDGYDIQYDHLVIVEKKVGKLIGTCRLSSVDSGDLFYAGNRFDLEHLFRQPGRKLEVGRVALRRDYGSVVQSLLWRGIAEYMSASQTQVLIACNSIQTQDSRQASLFYRYFQNKNRIISQYAAAPTCPYIMPKFALWMEFARGPLTPAEIAEVESLIPPLCRADLNRGAYIGGEPAWDAELKCIDFLTILHREDLNRTLWKRFKMDSEAS